MDIAFHLCWQYCNKYESPTTRVSFSLHNGLGGTFIWLITCQQPLPSVWSSNGYTKVILRIACMPTARGSPLSPRFTEQPLRDRKSIIIAEIGYCGGNKIVRWVHSCKLLRWNFPTYLFGRKHLKSSKCEFYRWKHRENCKLSWSAVVCPGLPCSVLICLGLFRSVLLVW